MLRSPMRILTLLVLVVIAPNLMWVSRSSVLLHNAAGEPLAVRLVLDDDPERLIDARTLAPGEKRFLWIDPAGEATLTVEVQEGIGWSPPHCGTYVEEGMYRVAVTIRSPREVSCETSLPILERLLVIDVLG